MPTKQKRTQKCKSIAIVGVPSDLGANIVGARYGPNRIRKYLIPLLKKKGIPFKDYGNVPVPKRTKRTDWSKKNILQIKQVCQHFALKRDFFRACLPVVLGGDHSIVFCLVKELTMGKKLGLLWFDAHGDFNTVETSPSGNVHGMVLATIHGRTLQHVFDLERALVQERNVAMIGMRDLDYWEEKLLEQSNITVFRMKEVRKHGIRKIVKKALRIATTGTEGFHLSFDVDCFDPKIAPGVSTPVKGGLSKNQVSQALRLFAASGKLHSLDIVEYNPRADTRDKTAKLIAGMIVEIAASLRLSK